MFNQVPPVNYFPGQTPNMQMWPTPDLFYGPRGGGGPTPPVNRGEINENTGLGEVNENSGQGEINSQE